MHPRPLAVLLLPLLLSGCLVIDVKPWGKDQGGAGIKGDGLVRAYATAGWPAEESILRIGLFDGPHDGTILHLTVWKLLRAEIGLLGASLGIGPLDAGLGVFFYEPAPPRYTRDAKPPEPEPAGEEAG